MAIMSPGNVGRDSSMNKSETGNTGSIGSTGPIVSPAKMMEKGSASTNQNIDVGDINKVAAGGVEHTGSSSKAIK